MFGHELNNSLAPIKSIAGSLEGLLESDSKSEDWQEDLRSGLSVISSRTAALTRFMEAYSRLAKLPAPQIQSVPLLALIQRVVNLEQRVKPTVKMGPEVKLAADPDQLEQLLINLVRNAVDASLEERVAIAETPEVEIGWTLKNGQIEIVIADNGPGIANPANLFVPFFTTKPGGSGVGLVLSRQIAEAHGGSLTVENRAERSGCVARLKMLIRGDQNLK